MEATTIKKYAITQEMKNKFISLVLINEAVNFQTYYSVKLENNDDFLAEYLKIMLDKGFLEIKADKYIPTEAGRNYLQAFFAKYYEYLKMFDIYCAVDLEKGEFAFDSINSDMDDAQWNQFLNDKRFSDVRIAVAEFKKIDPIEVVFMSFLNEGRFDTQKYGWQYNLTKGTVWSEIEDICNTAVSSEYLTPDGVLEDVIRQGTVIAMRLIKEAEEALAAAPDQDMVEEETVTETTETVEEYVDVVEMPYYDYGYWDPYYDPFYVSPLWLVLLW